jgi:hypothetical protein
VGCQPGAAVTPEACARPDLGAGQPTPACGTPAGAVTGAPAGADEAGEGVVGYGAAVRGMLNHDPGGPLHPPGVRMSEAFQEVRASLERPLDAKKGGGPRRCGSVWLVVWTAAWQAPVRP